jgi:hypothetical protein
MNPYLTKLRGLSQEKPKLTDPSEPSEPGFDGIGGEWSSHVSGNERVEFEQGYYGDTLAALRSKCPELVEPGRWQQAVHDANRFLNTWGAQAHTLGWTAHELFGLHVVPERPAATYRRLSCDHATGLIWLLQGRPVTALTETAATILASSGAKLTYYRSNKPASAPGDNFNNDGRHK